MIEIDGRQIEAIHMNYDTIEKFGSILDRPISGDEDLGVRLHVIRYMRKPKSSSTLIGWSRMLHWVATAS